MGNSLALFFPFSKGYWITRQGIKRHLKADKSLAGGTKWHQITRNNTKIFFSNPSPAANENRSFSYEMACFLYFSGTFCNILYLLEAPKKVFTLIFTLTSSRKPCATRVFRHRKNPIRRSQRGENTAPFLPRFPSASGPSHARRHPA